MHRPSFALLVLVVLITGWNLPGAPAHATDGKIYVADTANGLIVRLNLDGTGEEVLVDVVLPTYVCVDRDGGKAYWADGYEKKIQRANLDGSSVEDLVTTGSVSHLAIDPVGGKMYWIDPRARRIQRANRTG